ncbi:MAG: FAD:protein FMN transferase [Nitrosomonadales bacterium]|jgi:FAD:protein FMN transferase|nr:FAD:protein FMN transferase [Nitrosomonadales bacterium]
MPATKQSKTNHIKRCKPLLGTYVEVSVLSENNNNNTLIDLSECVFSEIQRIENLMSFHDLDSELSYINREAYNYPCSISKDMEEVLLAALNLSKVTNGIYDISIAPSLVRNGILPDQSIDVDDRANWQDISIANGKISFKRKLLIDLGGIAKGYAVDRALCLVEDQVKNITVNAGGDLRIKEWSGESVGIKASDTKGSNSLIFVPMHQAALATSSNYYMDVNKSAIIDPFTKKELKDKKSISVFASSCMLADALTKVAFLDITLIPIFKPLGVKVISIDESGNVQDLCEALEHG